MWEEIVALIGWLYVNKYEHLEHLELKLLFENINLPHD
jgi:hypothetical protein